MKFTQEQVKQIIKEEIENYVFEAEQETPFAPTQTAFTPTQSVAKKSPKDRPVASTAGGPSALEWEGELAQLVLPAVQIMARASAQKGVKPSVDSPQLKQLKKFLENNPVPQDSNRYEEFIKDEEAFRASVIDKVVKETEARIGLAQDQGGESMAALLDTEKVRKTNRKLELPELKRELSNMKNALNNENLTTIQKDRLKDSIEIYKNAIKRELGKIYDQAPKKRMPGGKTVDPTVLLTPGVEVPGV